MEEERVVSEQEHNENRKKDKKKLKTENHAAENSEVQIKNQSNKDSRETPRAFRGF